MKILLATAIAWAGVQFSQVGQAQEIEIMPNDLILSAQAEMGLINDLQLSSSGSSSSISMTNENGVTTTKIVDGTNRMTIIEDPASGIICKVTTTYGPNDLAKLEDDQPELFMHLSSIPKSVGEAEIELSVGVTQSYAAADKVDLKAKYPDVYQLYSKYTGERGLGRMQIRMPRPLRLRFDPDRALLQEADDGAEMDDDGDDDSDGDSDDDPESDDDGEGDRGDDDGDGS